MAKSNIIDRKQEPYTITIVGGGLSSFTLLEQIEKNLKLMVLTSASKCPAIRIEIIDAGSSGAQGKIAFNGLVWDKQKTLPCHVFNTYFSGENYSKDTFGRLSKQYPDIAKTIRFDMGEMPRGLYHELARKPVVSENLAALKKYPGVTVVETPGRSVNDIRSDNKGYRLTLDDGSTRQSDYVVLATGHAQDAAPKIYQNEGMYSSPWPVQKLQAINPDQPIAILGTSLSAVDAAMTLAEHAGRFTRDDKGKLHFEKGAYAQHFSLQLYSPHGMLPRVLGVNPDGHDYLPDRHLRYNKLGLVEQDSALRLMHLIAQSEEYYNFHDPELDALRASRSLKEFAQKLTSLQEAKSPQENLAEDLKTVEKCFKHNGIIPYQRFLRGTSTILEAAYNGASAEDQQQFMEHIHPVISKHAYGMVFSNAERILALMEAGCLEVHKLGPHSSVGTVKGKPGAEIRYSYAKGEHAVYYGAVVRAVGDEMLRLKRSSPLMESLFKSGKAQEVLTPYADQAKGKEAYEAQKNIPDEPMRVVEKKGIYYRCNGGLSQNKAMQLINAQGAPENIFGIGVVENALHPLVQGTNVIDESAPKIAKHIVRDIFHEQKMAVTNSTIDATTIFNDKLTPAQQRAAQQIIADATGQDPGAVTGAKLSKGGIVVIEDLSNSIYR